MVDQLQSAILSAVAGMRVQSTRVRVVAENIANSVSTSSRPGGDAYRRKTLTFKQELDRAAGVSLVQVREIGRDRSPLRVQHDPGHPAADASGNVKLPNVNPLVELADMREAHRSYEANMQVVRQVREMADELVGLMRSR
jgi:flagellar basal-body rod protein FlgC